jgi:hypothetical protein
MSNLQYAGIIMVLLAFVAMPLARHMGNKPLWVISFVGWIIFFILIIIEVVK